MRLPAEFKDTRQSEHVRRGKHGSLNRRGSVRGMIVTAIEKNKTLLANATSLVGTVGIASGLGFIYWAVAAKLFSQQAVGFGSAASSAMSLLGTVGMFGLGPMLMGELPRRRDRGSLVAAALIAAGIGSLVLGAGFVLIAPRLSSGFGFIAGSIGQVAIFMIGVVFTGVGRTFDQACIGMLKGGLQLSRNLVLAIAKVVTLPLSAIVFHDVFGTGIMLSWVAGIIVSLGWIAARVRRGGISIMPRPDWISLRRLSKVTMAHNWLNLAIFVPPALMPVLVTAVVSPAANASFYVSWMIANFLYIIPSSLSTVLFTVAAADAAAMAEKLRFTLRVSLYLGAPGMLVLFLGAHLILSIFGTSYAAAGTVPLWLFAAAYLPTIPVSHYIAVCRATDKVSLAAFVLTTSSALQVGAATAGGVVDGLVGLSVALVGVKFVEGLVVAPAVLRAARDKRGDVRASAADRGLRTTRADLLPLVTQGVPSRRSLDSVRAMWAADDDLARRQLEGIAALIAISMTDAATGPLPMLNVRARYANPPAGHANSAPARYEPYRDDAAFRPHRVARRRESGW